MAQTRIRSYIDENLSPKIITQLQVQGIDIIRGQLRADDLVHLERATAMRRVVCAEDDDFIKLASQGMAHAGIIYGEQDRYSIGDWVKYLRFVHAVHSADEMIDTINYVFYVD